MNEENLIRERQNLDLKLSDIRKWFESPDTWEIPYQLVAKYKYPVPDTTTHITWFFISGVIEKCLEIEKRILFRALPYFNKEVKRMYATQMSPEMWNFFIYVLSQRVPPTTNSFSQFTLPDHGFKRKEFKHKVSWRNNLPQLYNINWQYKKWVDLETHNLWRAQIKEMSLIHNSYTNMVRVEFVYETQIWRDSKKQWDFI
jgi:hypothetical protein